jgi:hypothetical protein
MKATARRILRRLDGRSGTPRARPDRRNTTRYLPFAAALAVVVTSAVSASPASAWPWDSHVDLNGYSSCHGEHADMVNISLSNGEGAAALPNRDGSYFLSFFRIASSGTSGTAYTRAASTGGWCSRGIKVSRPLGGTVQYLRLDM